MTTQRELIAAIADRELSRCVRERPVAMLPTMQTITFAVITQLVLGAQDPGVVHRLQAAMADLSSPSALAGTWMSPVADGWVREKMNRRWQGRRDTVHQILAQVVAARRLRRAAGPAAPEAGDVLDLLLDDIGAIQGADDDRPPSETQMRDGDLTDGLMALLIVGHETTASALGWAVDRLAHEPAIARRLSQSVATGDATYLRAFIRELLRWRPPVIDAVRELSESTVVLGYTLPAGTLVVVSPPLIHHDDRVFARPDTFEPERLLTAVAAGKPGELSRSQDWMPFGGGRRYCLGAELAHVEMEVVLARLVQCMTVKPARRQAARSRLHGTVVVPSRAGTAILTAA